MITQKEFVDRCYALYEAKGITPGDTRWGRWENAHFPIPECMGGEETVPLLHNHHQMQGIYQSEEMGRCCFLALHTKKFLLNNWCNDWFELFDLYEKWFLDHQSKAGKALRDRGLGIHAQTTEERSAAGRKGGKKGGVTSRNRKAGALGMTRGEHQAAGRKGGTTSKERGVGIHGRTPEQHSADSRKAGEKNRDEGIGFHALTTEQRSAIGKKGMEEGLGLFGRASEQHSADSKKGAAALHAQSWMSLADGFISGPGPVARHNKRIGADPKARVKIDDLDAAIEVFKNVGRVAA